VELDGCLRVLAADGSLRQGTPELVRLLESEVAAAGTYAPPPTTYGRRLVARSFRATRQSLTDNIRQ
jgi:hypothetical protein